MLEFPGYTGVPKEVFGSAASKRQIFARSHYEQMHGED